MDGAVSGDFEEAASQGMATEKRTDDVGVVVALRFRAVIVPVQRQDHLGQGLEGGGP